MGPQIDGSNRFLDSSSIDDYETIDKFAIKTSVECQGFWKLVSIDNELHCSNGSGSYRPR